MTDQLRNISGRGPLCHAAHPKDMAMEHCTCDHDSGHPGWHRCHCGFEWEDETPVISLNGDDRG